MKRAVLLILDGAGIRPDVPGNAVTPRTMPFLFSLFEKFGYAALDASGVAVGLEPGMAGNSEVGHTVIGAGFVPPTSLQRINNAFESGSWGAHGAWTRLGACPRLHIVGMLSDAGVHAHWRTLKQAQQVARAQCPGSEIVMHLVLDGVDSAAGSALALLSLFEEADTRLGIVIGRKWFCDRSGDLAATQVLVDALTGEVPAPPFHTELLREHLRTSSEASFPPHAYAPIAVAPGEPIILTSHRADRVRQVAVALGRSRPVYTMIEVDPSVAAENVFFPDEPLENGLLFEFAANGVRNTRIAESSKFPHVTRFINGLNEPKGEATVCIPSVPDGRLPDHPEMSLQPLVGAVMECLSSSHANQSLIVNVANLDQIGHLGKFDLACEAAGHVDEAVARIYEACQLHHWELVVTADHGNADQMLDDAGGPWNSHSCHPVPLLVIPSKGRAVRWLKARGSLANVAPTLLHVMGVNAGRGMACSLVACERETGEAGLSSLPNSSVGQAWVWH